MNMIFFLKEEFFLFIKQVELLHKFNVTKSISSQTTSGCNREMKLKSQQKFATS